jgi:PAS domain S-box-containing protein
MSPYALLSLLGFLVSLYLGTFVFLRNPKLLVNRMFLALSVSLAFWGLAEFCLRDSRTAADAQPWIVLFSLWRISLAVLLHFILVFTEQKRLLKKPLTYAALYMPAILFIVFGIRMALAQGLPSKVSWGWAYAVPRNAIFVSDMAWVFIMGVTCVILAIRHYVSLQSSPKKKQAKYVTLGICIPVATGLITYVVELVTQKTFPDFATSTFMVASALIGYGIWKHRLFTLTPATAANKIVSTMSDGVLIVNNDDIVHTVNTALCSMLGQHQHTLVGAALNSILVDDPRSPALSGKTWFSTFSTSGCISDIPCFLKASDGRLVPVSMSASALKDDNGDIAGIVFICRDITERKRAEEALRAANDKLENEVLRRTEELAAEKERLAVTLASIGDAVITTDISGKIVLVNAAAEQLTGWPAPEAVGRNLDECLYLVNERSETRRASPLLAVVRGQAASFPDDMHLVARSGARRNVSCLGAPIKDATGNITGMVLVIRDITDKTTLEAELFKARKLESMGVLAAGIANDFSVILSEIITHLFAAKIFLRAGDDAYRNITNAETAAWRASRITKQLLTFSKGGAPVKERASIKTLIEDSVGFSLSGSNASYRLDLPDDLPALDIDRGQIDQALSNLVVNADQATEPGGTITVTAANVTIQSGGEPSEGQYARGSNLEPGAYVCISILDEGPGIPPENLEKIFDPYFTTKPNCNGLGLTTAYSIVKKHGGFITVTSELGKGATFHMYLPVAEQTDSGQGCLGELKASPDSKLQIAG